jgi:hypothetical protein
VSGVLKADSLRQLASVQVVIKSSLGVGRACHPLFGTKARPMAMTHGLSFLVLLQHPRDTILDHQYCCTKHEFF